MARKKKETLGDRIKSLRGERSQRQYAKSIGVSGQMLSSYERNEKLPCFKTLEILRAKDGVDLNWLVAGK